MANVGGSSGGSTNSPVDYSLLGGGNEPAVDLTQQQLANYNVQRAQDYVAAGGNPADVSSSFGYGSSLGAQMVGGGSGSGSTGLYGGSYGGGYGTAGYAAYAPYDEGGGHTKWDEFVQQMQLEQQKLAQDKALQEEQLAQQKLLQEEQLAEQKYESQQTNVTDFDKQLNDMKGPADPYGYLFASRGLAAPQGYQPVGLPMSDAVKQAYGDQGIDLAQAQAGIVGSAGPSFIKGYLGGMPNVLQQGPMGFQNSSQLANVAPGSQPQPNEQPTPQQPAHLASGGTIPGYAPGQDTVPAKLSPGEGVLTPEAVQMLGGPQAIEMLNQKAVQHFATGGVVQPLGNQQLTDLGNGLVQRGAETGLIRQQNPYTAAYDAAHAGVPIRDAPGGNIFGEQNFNQGSGFTIAGAPVQGPNNFAPNDTHGSTLWYPVLTANGQHGFISSYDLDPNGFTMPVTGNRQSLDPYMPAGFQLMNAGVATRGGTAPLPSAPTGMPGPIDRPVDLSQGQLPGDWVSQVERHFTGPSQTLGPSGIQSSTAPQIQAAAPIGSATSAPVPPPIGSNAAAGSGSPVLLTGGQINAPGPVNGPPMNLNMLDPYTRSMVDQYGRPQIPSMQAWNTMPQSGQQAYQNYVEKVAGGNFQDLLDKQQQLAPQGANAGNLRFS